ncbi:ScbR family autoregulator-binding transcription factor [Streptacidiphilus neutrinimicus]|uniref:ScbR family autoregulator-binding transcription factor n=1 Tax=Streptacidiphilus neutrinimicus TaxID=105420 RepID=UPI0005A90DB5|nr:ScbR family autoregulator-binding transcription factor [Streptacidiphilus neutrinimicus]
MAAGRTVKQARAERTRDTLIQAAAEVFGELGFAGASMMKIADRAGLTMGAVYFHFRSKDELAQLLVQEQPKHVVPPHASEGLQQAVDITLTWAYRMPKDPILQAGARLVWEQENFASPQANSHDQWTEIISEALQVALARRELRAGTDVDTLSRLVVDACTGAQMRSYVETSDRTRPNLPERVEDMWHCLLPAFAVPSAVKRIEMGEGRTHVAA